MASQALLFQQGDLRSALEGQAQALEREVQQVPEDHLLHVDEDEWIEALVSRYSVEPPELHADQWEMDEPQEIQVDVSYDHMRRAIIDPSRPVYISGYRVVVHIPFTGEADVFKFRPSSFNWSAPQAEVREQEVRYTIEYPHDTPADVLSEANALVGKIQQYLTWARGDIESFNGTLATRARTAIQTRRSRLLENKARLEATGIPIRRKSGERRPIADVIVRRPAPRLPARTDVPMPLEPVMQDEVFDHILGVIRAVAQTMEQSPDTYAPMGEEDRRQVFLTALNSHYHGQASAEAFNVAGKTDILIRWEGQSLFIAECKFWSGQKGFTATIDQLFSYAGWRDTKLAVIMFVRERALTDIVGKANEALAAHRQFLRWRDTTTETELRAAVKWPGDDSRHAELNVFFVHTPSST